MSQPNISTLHINQPLSNVMVTYAQTEPSLMRSVFAVVSVDKPTDSYFVWNKGDMKRLAAKRRAAGTKPAEAELRVSSDSYTTAEWGLRVPLTEEQIAASDIEIQAPVGDYLGNQIMMAESLEFISTYMVGSVWGTDETFSADERWNDYGQSHPIRKVREIKRTIKTNTGYRPNVCVMNDEVADTLVEHPDVLSYLKGMIQPTGIGEDERATMLSAAFGLQVIIADQSYNTAAYGATATMAAMLGDNVLFAFKQPSPSKQAPSAGYVFSWSGLDRGGAVEVYEDGDKGVGITWAHAKSFAGPKVVCTDCGYLCLDVLGQ